jgi:hypothetical protein
MRYALNLSELKLHPAAEQTGFFLTVPTSHEPPKQVTVSQVQPARTILHWALCLTVLVVQEVVASN